MPSSPIEVRDFTVPPLDHASNLGTREIIEIRLHSLPSLRWVQLFRATAHRFSKRLVSSNPRISDAVIAFESAPVDAVELCREFLSLVDRVNEAVALNEEASPADLQRRQAVHSALRDAVTLFRREWLEHQA